MGKIRFIYLDFVKNNNNWQEMLFVTNLFCKAYSDKKQRFVDNMC